MKILTGPMISFFFIRYTSVAIRTTHGLNTYPHLTLQVKSTASETSAKPRAVFTDDALTKPPMTTKTITAFVDHPSEWNTTSTVTSLEKLIETAILLLFHSKSTKTDKKVAVRVTNTIESLTRSEYF